MGGGERAELSGFGPHAGRRLPASSALERWRGFPGQLAPWERSDRCVGGSAGRPTGTRFSAPAGKSVARNVGPSSSISFSTSGTDFPRPASRFQRPARTFLVPHRVFNVWHGLSSSRIAFETKNARWESHRPAFSAMEYGAPTRHRAFSARKGGASAASRARPPPPAAVIGRSRSRLAALVLT